MSLGFTPAIEIYGANAALLNERLLSWVHVDAAGTESDQLTLTITLEGLEGLPSLAEKSAFGSVIWSRGWWIKASLLLPGSRRRYFRCA